MNTGRFRKVGWLRATPFFRKRWRLSRFVWCIWHLITTCWVITCEIHLQKLAAQSKLSGSPKLFLFFFVFTGSFDCMLLFLFCFDRQILIALFYLLWLPFFMVSNIFKILFSILIFFYYITPTLTFSSASSMVLLVSDMPLWDHFHLDLKRSGTTKLSPVT